VDKHLVGTENNNNTSSNYMVNSLKKVLSAFVYLAPHLPNLYLYLHFPFGHYVDISGRRSSAGVNYKLIGKTNKTLGYRQPAIFTGATTTKGAYTYVKCRGNL